MRKAIKYTLVAAVAAIAVTLFWNSFEGKYVKKKPLSGYLNHVYVEFPKDRYTFLVTNDLMAGRTFITDNLWGYRYPSMEPLTRETSGEFMKAYAHTDWIKANVKVRNYTPKPSEPEAERKENMCFKRSIDRLLTPGEMIYLRNNDVFIKERQLYFGSLKRLSAPDKPEYQDPKQSGLPVHIYWDESSGNACTLIQCKKYQGGFAGYSCQHLLVDTESGFEYSMRYDSTLLPHWLHIQSKTVAIFNSFKK